MNVLPIQRISQRQLSTSNPDKYATIEDQLHGMSKPFFEFKRPTEGQTRMTLGSGMTYQVGAGQLKVHLNGQLLEPGLSSDYVELTEIEVEFNFPLSSQDIVLFRIEGAGGGVATSDHAHYNSIPLEGVVDGINKKFTMPHIARYNTVAVYINGVRQHPNYFVVTLNVVEFKEAPVKGSELMVDYVV